MPQSNKAVVVAGLRPGGCASIPRKECWECGLSLELSPEYGWFKVRGGQETGTAGASLYLTLAMLDLIGAVSSFPAFSEIIPAI